ncbi:hypothetical protein Ddye_006533 [Dipteronia dyeriana]|uniref:hAT-like transposase RNase-H fold domain-containing protein n=1 Tax=Dipteronia dyeriana TaxID=168575 RepID=A0AAD9XIA1_9ROSI|nr:hypothetical protein Ddye_006533 [Dipteronia dyeriana]
MENSDVFLKKMVIQMYNKYHKYWGQFSVILAIALILDPRYKMMFVEFAYKKVYGIDSPELDIVRSKLLSLFNEYTFTSMSTRESNSTSLPSSSRGGDTMTDTGGDIFVSESLEVDEVAEDILKLTLENSPCPSIESATSQFGD